MNFFSNTATRRDCDRTCLPWRPSQFLWRYTAKIYAEKIKCRCAHYKLSSANFDKHLLKTGFREPIAQIPTVIASPPQACATSSRHQQFGAWSKALVFVS